MDIFTAGLARYVTALGMRPTTQPREGLCFEAALATLLNLPLSEVPERSARPEDDRLSSWLRHRGQMQCWGLLQGNLPMDPPVEVPVVSARPFLLRGRTPSGSLHWVVGQVLHSSGQICWIWDPHPSRAGIVNADTLLMVLPLEWMPDEWRPWNTVQLYWTHAGVQTTPKPGWLARAPTEG